MELDWGVIDHYAGRLGISRGVVVQGIVKMMLDDCGRFEAEYLERKRQRMFEGSVDYEAIRQRRELDEWINEVQILRAEGAEGEHAASPVQEMPAERPTQIELF